METIINQSREEDARLADDVLYGAPEIKSFVISIGMPATTNPYYLKKIGWPIGNANGDNGPLVALKPRIRSHWKKIAGGKVPA